MHLEKRLSDKLYSAKPDKELLLIEKRSELNTGIPDMDNDFGFPTGYYVIVGNPGAGKSWFALWLSRVFFNFNGVKSVYFSLEMPEPTIRQRILQQWSDLTKAEFESGTHELKALGHLRQDVIVVDDFFADEGKYQTVENFEKLVDDYYEIGYRVFHFDHLHELDGANSNQTNQSVTEKWAKAFQKLLKKYKDAWLFVYTQPNGAAADKKILRRTDISGSKAITQKCDYFLSINKPVELDESGLTVTNKNDRNIIIYVDKSRYTEKVHIGFKLYFAPSANFFGMTEYDSN